jgi:hypothetical protein
VSLQQPTRQREIARPIMAQLEIDGSTQETEAAFQELEIGESRPSLTEDALLVENLRDGTAGKKEQAAHTLADRARYSPNRFAIVRAGGIRPLVALMRNGENGGKNQAVRALMNLAQHDDIRKAIDKADGIAPLLALDAIAHPTAAKALTNLSSTQVGRKLVAKARASGEEQAATGRMINLGFRNVPVLTGRYRSDFDEGEVLGRGGFGTVVKATNKLD